jgi:hypothetical protein
MPMRTGQPVHARAGRPSMRAHVINAAALAVILLAILPGGAQGWRIGEPFSASPLGSGRITAVGGARGVQGSSWRRDNAARVAFQLLPGLGPTFGTLNVRGKALRPAVLRRHPARISLAQRPARRFPLSPCMRPLSLMYWIPSRSPRTRHCVHARSILGYEWGWWQPLELTRGIGRI